MGCWDFYGLGSELCAELSSIGFSCENIWVIIIGSAYACLLWMFLIFVFFYRVLLGWGFAFSYKFWGGLQVGMKWVI